MGKRHPNVLNLSEVEAQSREEGERFGFTMRRIGVEAGNTMVGANWYEVAPGRQAFPRHYHCANEESIFILEGEGEAHIGKDKVKVGSNDFISFPVGPDHAHALVNIGTKPLRYLCFSSMLPTEICGYPDSKKIGVFGSPTAGKEVFTSAWHLDFFKEGTGVGYYDGEEAS